VSAGHSKVLVLASTSRERYIAYMLLRRLPTLFSVLFCLVPPGLAQLPKRLERCLPNPTLAQEIRDMQPEPQKVTLHVARVEFDQKSGIPMQLQREITADVRRGTFQEDEDSDYLKKAANEIAEVGVRGPLQNRGYFRPRYTVGTRMSSQIHQPISQRASCCLHRVAEVGVVVAAVGYRAVLVGDGSHRAVAVVYEVEILGAVAPVHVVRPRYPYIKVAQDPPCQGSNEPNTDLLKVNNNVS
jgi:hypothetical protein